MMELTREKVLAMEAGTKMDILIAERVMGLELEEGRGMFEISPWAIHLYPESENEPNLVVKKESAIDGQVEIPKYSTNISAAWEVVEKLRENYWSTIDNGMSVEYPKVAPFSCSIGKYGIPGSVYADADTAPLAICRAALLTTISD